LEKSSDVVFKNCWRKSTFPLKEFPITCEMVNTGLELAQNDLKLCIPIEYLNHKTTLYASVVGIKQVLREL